MKISKPLVVVVLVLCAVLFADTEMFAQGCSACKAAAETGTDGNGILYLMAVPYVLLFIFFRKRILAFLKELRSLWA